MDKYEMFEKFKAIHSKLYQSIYEFVDIVDSNWDVLQMDNASVDASFDSMIIDFDGLKKLSNDDMERLDNIRMDLCAGDVFYMVLKDLYSECSDDDVLIQKLHEKIEGLKYEFYYKLGELYGRRRNKEFLGWRNKGFLAVYERLLYTMLARVAISIQAILDDCESIFNIEIVATGDSCVNSDESSKKPAPNQQPDYKYLKDLTNDEATKFLLSDILRKMGYLDEYDSATDKFSADFGRALLAEIAVMYKVKNPKRKSVSGILMNEFRLNQESRTRLEQCKSQYKDELKDVIEKLKKAALTKSRTTIVDCICEEEKRGFIIDWLREKDCIGLNNFDATDKWGKSEWVWFMLELFPRNYCSVKPNYYEISRILQSSFSVNIKPGDVKSIAETGRYDKRNELNIPQAPEKKECKVY